MTCTDVCASRYTGKERDAESGLDYFGARYYASSMGRFMSPDYSDDEDGPQAIPYAFLGDPQSLNLYSYVRNNPLNGIDPDGHLDCPGGATQDVACAVTAAVKAVWGWLKSGTSNNQNTSVTMSSTASLNGQDLGSDPLQAVPQQQTNFMIRANNGTLNLWQTSPTMYRRVGTYSYSTGRNGDTNPADANQGPLPPGDYTILPQEISAAGFFRKHIDPRDWGDYRVPLHPNPGTNVYGRSGFFLHGGRLRHGSEGCIKVESCNQNDLFRQLMNASGPVTLTETHP